MRVVQLPSCAGSDAPFQYLASFVINDAVALDAGSLGFWGDVGQQARVRHVLLTHAHLDHLASLPMLLENVFTEGANPVNVYGTADVLHALQADVFNDRIFPDFIRISQSDIPFLKLHLLVPGETVTVAGSRITPIPVDHVVPTVAFLVRDDTATIAYVTDTAPTTAIWGELKREANLKAVFLEATFPKSMNWLAEISKHLSTETFALEVEKIPPGVPVYAIHLKAKFRGETVAELAALGMPRVSVCEPGRVYEF